MRIVLLLQDTGKVYGAERATVDLAAGLRAAGHEPRVLLIEETRLGLTSSALREALDVARIPWSALPVSGRFSAGLVNAVRQQLHRLDAAVLHTTGYKADLHGGWAAGWGQRWPVVSTVHGWLFRRDVRERFYGGLNRACLRRCQRVIVLSRYYEQLLAAQGFPASRLVRIPSGLDPAPFATLPGPAASTPFTVGLAGRLSEEKNHALLLRAAARLRAAGVNVRFLIAGDGPLAGALREEIARAGLSDRVELAGFLPREHFLARVHAVVLCSRIENLPYSVLEAMAAGRPVVATCVGGLPDLVEDGRTGALVADDDEVALAARLGELAADPARVSAWGRAGREKLEREFRPDQVVAAHLRLYREIATRD